MARVGTSRDLVIYGKRIIRVSTARDFHVTDTQYEQDSRRIDPRFDTPVSHNETVEMA